MDSCPIAAASSPAGAGPTSRVQERYLSVCGPKCWVPFGGELLALFGSSLFPRGQGLGSFVCDFVFCSFGHAATDYGVKTSEVKQREHAEEAHGGHLQNKDSPVSSPGGTARLSRTVSEPRLLIGSKDEHSANCIRVSDMLRTEAARSAPLDTQGLPDR